MTDASANYAGDDFYCDVALKGVVSLRKEYESEAVLAYHHTRPFWPVHIVVIPKKHIASFVTLSADDMPIFLEMVEVMKTLSAKVTAEHGAARILTNLGRYQGFKAPALPHQQRRTAALARSLSSAQLLSRRRDFFDELVEESLQTIAS